jgi:hypothetical protein
VSNSVNITVAFIGDPEAPFDRLAPEAEWNRPYAERRKVALKVSLEQSLAEILEAAADRMGLAPGSDSYTSRFRATHNGIAFYKAEDESGFAPRYVPRFLLSELTLVDKQGRAIFGVSDLRAVRFRDLLEAADAGTLHGDPYRPYLIIEPPYGDWVGPDWPTLLEGLKVTWQVLEHVATAGGVLAFGKLVADEVRGRLQRGREAVAANPQWAQRRTMPYQFVALVRSRDWKTDELAPLLDCTGPDAEAVLFALGFSYDAQAEVWRYGGDPAADVLGDLLREIQIAAHRYGDDEMDQALTSRLQSYLEEGQLQRTDDSTATDDDLADVDFGPTLGERVGDIVDGGIEFVRDARRVLASKRRRRHTR